MPENHASTSYAPAPAPTPAPDNHPQLTRTAHTLQYRLAGETLCYVATRFAWTQKPVADEHLPTFSLLITSGVGLTSDLWTPVVQRLFELQAQRASPFRLASAWAVDRPTHGDAAVHNAPQLERMHGTLCASDHYTTALSAFLRSDVLTPHERAHLVGLGHSAGTGPLVLQIARTLDYIPYRGLVLVEPPLFEAHAAPAFDAIVARVRTANARRPARWRTRADAAAAQPWRRFAPAVRALAADTYFAEEDGGRGVRCKTPAREETAAFDDFAGALETVRRATGVLRAVPVHLVLAAQGGFWPRALEVCCERVVKRHQGGWASVAVVRGASHYVPQEQPEHVALLVFRAIRASVAAQARL